MNFYATETSIGLLVASIPALFSIYLFFVAQKEKKAIVFLLIGAFILRFFIAYIDPYLNDWDEHYHALVAKRMVNSPFKPMLYSLPVLPYEIGEWWRNHIWLHKQPLFLWQAAVSMKIFGVNVMAFRLPSIIMGTASIWLIFDLAKKWLNNTAIAFLAALLCTFSYAWLEHISGRLVVDHNDVAFSFYCTLAIWAFVNYTISNNKSRWAFFLGACIGFAILNKWLVALVIYLGWFVWYLLQKPVYSKKNFWQHFITAVITTIIVVLPWQIFINVYYPIESAWEMRYNAKHFFNVVEGHKGPFWFHLYWSLYNYGVLLFPLSICGIYLVMKNKQIDKALTIVFSIMLVVVYLFFTFAKTKMPAYTWFLNALVFIYIAYAVYRLIELIKQKVNVKLSNYLFIVLITILLIDGLKPKRIIEKRSISNEWRNEKLAKLKFYKNYNEQLNINSIIFNCTNHSFIDAMFHTRAIAYENIPSLNVIDSLTSNNYEIFIYNDGNLKNIANEILLNKRVQILE